MRRKRSNLSANLNSFQYGRGDDDCFDDEGGNDDGGDDFDVFVDVSLLVGGWREAGRGESC